MKHYDDREFNATAGVQVKSDVQSPKPISLWQRVLAWLAARKKTGPLSQSQIKDIGLDPSVLEREKALRAPLIK